MLVSLLDNCTGIHIPNNQTLTDLKNGVYAEVFVHLTNMNIPDDTYNLRYAIPDLDAGIQIDELLFSSMPLTVDSYFLLKVEIKEDDGTLLQSGVILYDCNNLLNCKTVDYVKKCPGGTAHIIYEALTTECESCDTDDMVKLYNQLCKELDRSCPDISLKDLDHDCGCN